MIFWGVSWWVSRIRGRGVGLLVGVSVWRWIRRLWLCIIIMVTCFVFDGLVRFSRFICSCRGSGALIWANRCRSLKISDICPVELWHSGPDRLLYGDFRRCQTSSLMVTIFNCPWRWEVGGLYTNHSIYWIRQATVGEHQMGIMGPDVVQIWVESRQNGKWSKVSEILQEW